MDIEQYNPKKSPKYSNFIYRFLKKNKKVIPHRGMPVMPINNHANAATAEDGNGKPSRPLRRLNVEHYGRASHEHQMPELRCGA